MGEYANRLADGQNVKVGTCEAMYYLRWEDRHKVDYPHADDPGLSFRLPFPDEDGILPGGDFEDYQRGVRLMAWKDPDDPDAVPVLFDSTDCADHPGSIQLTHPSGLLLSVPCYHGHRLPDVAEGMRAHWNGKDPYPMELVRVKNHPGEGLLPLIRCRYCGQLFRSTWAEVLPHVGDEQLRERLAAYAVEPILEADPGPPT